MLRDDVQAKTTLAHHRLLNRHVVIKLRKKKIEAQRLAAIMAVKGSHIGEVFGAGLREGSVILVREYLDGGTLADRIADRMSSKAVAECLIAIVSALREAKKHNLAHGHLHPGNVLYASNGCIKVVDFGLFSTPNPDYEHYRRGPDGRGSLYGDRHALGAMTYEMLTGVRFDPSVSPEVLFEQVSQAARPHPMLKYFLGRLWQIKRHQPPFSGYLDMLADLERIHSRVSSQEASTQSPAPAASPASPAAPERKKASLLQRTLALLINSSTLSKSD